METEQTTEAPKQKRKPAAKKRARTKVRSPASTAAPKQDAIYAGISAANCPTACNAERCVISGRGICAHPYKGGLQPRLQTPEATRRLNEAKRVIGKRKLDVATE